MSYRKITVEGRIYEYTVGKTHTKVKGLSVIENTKIGHMIPMKCECCGEPVKGFEKLAVGPADVSRFIQATNLVA